MSEKKLVYILNRYGAAEASHFHHILGLLETMAEQGCQIALVIEKADSIPAFRTPRVRVIPLRRRKGVGRFLELFATIRALIKEGYTSTFVRIAAPAALTATAAHRIFGGAVFFWQSGTTLEYDREQPWSLKKARWFVTSHLPNCAARRLVHFFVTGPSFMVDYYATVGRVRRDKIRLLYNDIDVRRFAPSAERKKGKQEFLQSLGYRGDELLMLLVHRMSPVRRTLLYFPSCLAPLKDEGLLQDVVVVVAGAGPELPAVRAAASDSGVSERCIFLGNVANKEIEKLYGMSDLFLHPTYNEGFPRVVLEAMAAGLPIASTDAGGTRELLGPVQGELVVSRDEPAAFAEILALLVRDRALREGLSRENLQWVQRYSTEEISAMYQEVLFA
ncbi:glycosyltransferase family 4 protein [Geomonas sp. RF6]|uniref:glycosyltransferase family 4 protein n=1 Tax=Geomonas sp. RF6 TaxID=2897342 RepID=UPI001E35FFC6|nr:glycosyltransferase family 4 protein [Geomonas sp. RF6]UFS69929.1 glycosyltransferase family 4 protein [Geomonas sp. RF6]